MSGKGPADINISECDVSVEGFQGICSAWFALDHENERPKYFDQRSLPMSIGISLKFTAFVYM